MSVGRPRWTSPSTCSIACWTWDARATSASPDPDGVGGSAAAPMIRAPRCQAVLLRSRMALLGRIAIGEPDCRAMAVHYRPDHRGGARRRGLMNDGVLAAKHPVIRVCALDPHPGLVRSDDRGPAQRRAGILAWGLELTLRPAQQVHQPALADGEPEQVGERTLQPLVGQRLEGLEVSCHRM